MVATATIRCPCPVPVAQMFGRKTNCKPWRFPRWHERKAKNHEQTNVEQKVRKALKPALI